MAKTMRAGFARRAVVACAVLAAGLVGSPPTSTSAGAGESAPPRLAGVADRLSAGTLHNCVIIDSGEVSCWGRGEFGRLGTIEVDNVGDDELVVQSDLVSLTFPRTAIAVTAGQQHTCALLDDGSVSCWGLAEDGQLGYGNTSNIGDTESPAGLKVAMPGQLAATAIVAGSSHTCALLRDASVTCWGAGGGGQLGYGNPDAIGDDETPAANPVNGGRVPLPAGRSAIALAAGASHTCALLDNRTVICWGNNGFGQLGRGHTSNIGDDETIGNITVAVPGARPVIAITAGFSHTCAVLDNGSVTCWGNGANGQLGYGNTNLIGDNETPIANPAHAGLVPLPAGRTAHAVTADGLHTCALLDNGTITCWGHAPNGQLGYGNTNNIGDNETPATNPANGGIVALPGNQTAIAVTAGGAHTCAMLVTGTITCWGEAVAGELGYGNVIDIGDNETPAANPVNGGIVQLPGQRAVSAVATGALHACGLLDNGSVTCWGSGTYGQLGYGNTNDIGDNETPGANPALGGLVSMTLKRRAVALAAGAQHTCALLDDGVVTCWGRGFSGRLGLGNTNNIGDNETPESVVAAVILPGSGKAAAISAGEAHTCALLDDGSVVCWGEGDNGRLGYGNTTDIGDNETPAANTVNGGLVPLPEGRTATSISAGDAHTCARLDDGTITCWGAGSFGRLGYGNTNDIGDNETPRNNPVSAGRVPMPTGRTAVAVSAGGFQTCVLLDNGSITCWGAGVVGRLGYGNSDNIGDNETPATNPVNGGIVQLPGGRAAVSVNSAAAHTCAVLDDATLACWGAGGNGRLGYGNTNNIGDNETPAANPIEGGLVPLPDGVGGNPIGVVAVAGGDSYTCAVSVRRTVICWGAGSFGRLGYGNTTSTGDNEFAAAGLPNGGAVAVPVHPSLVEYRALQPARLLDTRPSGTTADGQFQKGGQRSAGSTLVLTVAGRGGVPVDAASVTLSVAAIQPTASGFLTVWPCASPQPNASNLNFAAGVNTANTVITGIDGDVCIFTSQATQLITDAVGFTPRTGTLETITPTRYLDTRASGSTFDDFFEGTGAQAAGTTVILPVASRGPVPFNVRTVVLNVTAVQPAAGLFVTVFPCGSPRPNSSSLNAPAGVTTANLVITRVPSSGEVCLFTSGATQLIVDVVGFFNDGATPTRSTLRSLNPGRMVDTRPAGATTDLRFRQQGPVVANATNSYPISHRFPLASANVAVLNITVVSPPGVGFLTVWPCDLPKPTASSLNFTSGVTRAVQVLTKLSPAGTVCVASSVAVNLIIDASGTAM